MLYEQYHRTIKYLSYFPPIFFSVDIGSIYIMLFYINNNSTKVC